MKAIVIDHFGGLDSLVIKEIPKPEPKEGYVVIQVKAFGINHAEIHMRRGEWAEAAEVSGIECVGIVDSCPGGEFAVGSKVAALMGGLGRTIHGSYAEYTRARVTGVVQMESDLPWEQLAAIPESYATAWTCLFRNLEITKDQTLLIRGATSALGLAALNLAVNAGVKAIATTRNQETLSEAARSRSGAGRSRKSGAFAANCGGKKVGCRPGFGRQQYDSRFASHLTPRWPRLPGRLARRPCTNRRFQSLVANGKRRISDLLWQFRFWNTGVSPIRCALAKHRG
jgi:D-arabinose 1-dehydrogenase-like Zn-dependent alcohol dehydrogenase